MMELDRIKRNVSKMVGMNAPESDIDAYIASEGATIDQVRSYGLTPKLPEQDARITALQEPGAAQRVLRGVPILGGALDEIGAGADAALNYVSGGRVGEPYEQSLARRREAIATSDAAHPVRNTVDSVLGSVVAAQGLPYAQPFGGNGMLAAGGNATVNAVAAAAPSGFTEGEGGFENRLQNALDYSKLAVPLAFAGGAALSRFQTRQNGTPQNSVVRDGQNIGVQVPTFMEGGRTSESIASKLGAIPFVGDDINAAVAATRNQTQQAAENISNTVSPNVLVREAGENARNAMTDWAGDGARAVSDRVYAPVNSAMANVTAPLTNTQQAAAELARQQGVTASPIHARALGEIEAALAQPNGLSFEGITRLRTRIGAMMDNSIDPENRTARAGLAAIYGGLTHDMEAAVAQYGGPWAQRAWQRANAITRQIAERRNVVARIVGADGDKTGESIVDRIVAMAGTKSSADAARLNHARRIMGADAWRQVAGNAIVRLGRNQSNQFSPDIFLKNFDQLSNEGRRLLFQTTGDDNLLPALQSLANISNRLQRFSRLGNPSGTGGVTALLAALGGAASGDMGATLATAVGGRGVGMLMSRPSVVRAVTQHAQNMARFAGDHRTRAALATTAANLAGVVSKETGEDPRELQARILAVSTKAQPDKNSPDRVGAQGR